MPSDPVGVAIVTGGSSGIGLALTNHLATKNWHVFILDIQAPISPTPTESTTFLQTDISDWDQLASAFQTAHARFSRLDFVALNAGIDDRDDIFASISGDAARPPRRPNMLTFAVNLYGPYYGLKLAAHYMSLPAAQADNNTGTGGGKVVITSSVAGFRAHPPNPQYSSSKYGLLGLSRAVAPAAAARAGIRVNCVCPAVVATGLAPPGLMEAFPASIVTPMATMMRAFDELGEFDRLAKDGREKWAGSGPNGAVVEVNLQDLIYREEPKMDGDSSVDPGIAEAWRSVYEERNKRFAAMNQGG
ncbi:hypothetical protein LA080_000364 [Diaporthe eres]|uniref:15-hydroxyprostaglandin dehydrogenase n=1 Tax=Diaporthe vaccinii TaxID=105482 RepID=A0ABR4EEH0_9PEZI|nr:hypothetical protein LA080_000364 [Diaporthe eres]